MTEDDLKYFYERMIEERAFRRHCEELGIGSSGSLFHMLEQRRIDALAAPDRDLIRRPAIVDPI
jgi:hypothetical protein